MHFKLNHGQHYVATNSTCLGLTVCVHPSSPMFYWPFPWFIFILLLFCFAGFFIRILFAFFFALALCFVFCWAIFIIVTSVWQARIFFPFILKLLFKLFWIEEKHHFTAIRKKIYVLHFSPPPANSGIDFNRFELVAIFTNIIVVPLWLLINCIQSKSWAGLLVS